MEAGLSAWQQITRCLFIVAFTDKHSSFPLCPAECTHNVSSNMEFVVGKLSPKTYARKASAQIFKYFFSKKKSSTEEQICEPHESQTKKKILFRECCL